MLTPLIVRLRALLFRRSVDAELDEEMRYHLDREIERNVANGMSLVDARDAARRAFGNVAVATEHARDASRWRPVEELRQDLAYALRTFRRKPLFVATVVATIGLGLGLLTTAFTLLDAYVLRPNAVLDPGTLYDISWHTKAGKWNHFNADEVRVVESRHDAITESFAYANLIARVRGVPAVGQLVSGNYFQMLGAGPALGRVLMPEDAGAPGAGAVVVLANDTWKSLFGGDSSVIGTSTAINGVRLRIVGVAREGFGGLDATPMQFWIPVTMLGQLDPARNPYGDHPAEALRLIGRIRRGMGEERAASALLPLLQTMTADLPPALRASEVNLESRATPIVITSDVVAAFMPLAIALLLVMLIACANVANVMLARGMARQREIGVRLALGASRRRLVRQLLTESVLLSLPAAIAGYIISRGAIALGLYVVTSAAPEAFRSHIRLVPLTSDSRVAAFMFAAAIVAAVLFGLAPALQTTRPSIVQATRGDFDSHLRPSRMRGALVVAQVMVSAVLLICAGILLRTAGDARGRDPGVRIHNLVQLELIDATRSRALADVRAMPEVVSTAAVATAPIDGIFQSLHAGPAGAPAHPLRYNLVSPEYFGAVDLPILRGRNFSESEARARAPVVVVSDATARQLWPAREPLGQHLVLAPEMLERASLARYHQAVVIGVVANARPGWIALPAEDPVVYYPQPFDGAGATVMVRTRGDAETDRRTIEPAISDSTAIRESHTTEASLDLQLFPFDIAYWVASLVGGIALLLTLIGVYGVVSYVVAQRTRELGVRMALGASAGMMIALVMRQLSRLAIVGLGFGLVLAVIGTRLLSSIAYAVAIDDVIGYAIGVGVVLVAALLAAYIPARRAGLVDPVEALRAD